jgi:hypothetical protein
MCQVEFWYCPTIPGKTIDLDLSDEEIGESDEERPDISDYEIIGEKEGRKSRLAIPTKEHDVTILSDDESDSEYAESVHVVKETFYANDDEDDNIDGIAAVKTTEVLAQMESADEDVDSEMQSDESGEEEEEDSDDDMEEEEHETSHDFVSKNPLPAAISQEVVKEVSIDEESDSDEALGTIASIPVQGEIVLSLPDEDLTRVVQADAEQLMAGCASDLAVGQEAIAEAYQGNAVDEAGAKEVRDAIVTVKKSIEVTTTEADIVPSSVDNRENASTPLAGTKRSFDEAEDKGVTAEAAHVLVVTECSTDAGASPGRTTASPTSPPPQKKAKQVGAAFSLGMATGLFAGVVGTFVGLSSFALSDSTLS